MTGGTGFLGLHLVAELLLTGRHVTLPARGDGTGHVLGLASLAAPTAPLRHISTAFVAGTRQGVVTEDDAGPPEGFENRCEHSKHEAERLVRDYAARRGGRALIFRPSVLIPPGTMRGRACPPSTSCTPWTPRCGPSPRPWRTCPPSASGWRRPEGRALRLAARYDPDVVDRGRVLRMLDGLRHLVL